MVKKILISILFAMFILPGSAALGDNDFEDKLKDIAGRKDRGGKIVIDDVSRAEMYAFLNKNEHLSVKDFKKLRLAGTASDIVLRDLEKKYGATFDNYQAKIVNEKDKKIYQVAFKLRKKMYYKEFYACKDDDEEKTMESLKKVDKIKNRKSELLSEGKRSAQDSDNVIALNEQILEECKFHDAAYWLLDSYRIRGLREKFNNLMLRMIKDDQVNFDYLYTDIDKLNTRFISQYLLFLQHVNRHGTQLILSKDDVNSIAEALLTKHQEVFNMRKAPYYSVEKGLYNENSIHEGVQSLVNVSTWLRDYNMDDLNNKLIERFFKDEMVISTLRDDPWFKDFWNYLLQRPEIEKYH